MQVCVTLRTLSLVPLLVVVVLPVGKRGSLTLFPRNGSRHASFLPVLPESPFVASHTFFCGHS